MLWRLLTFLVLLLCGATAQGQNIVPDLVAESRAVPGGEVELAIVMRPKPGWHGYWLNPGDAGLPMQVEWQLPAGFSVAPLRYPVPTRLSVAGLMNYVYERDYALLTRLKVPAGATGTILIRASATWLACTDKVCVPEKGEFSLTLPTGGMATADTRFNEWRRALPRPLTTPAHYVFEGGQVRLAIPLPASLAVADPYVFPITDEVVDYEGEQSFRRNGDWLIIEMPTKAPPEQSFDGVLALRGSTGFQFHAVPSSVPRTGTPLASAVWSTMLWAVLGAILGGILLNLMPCVFPILALKALHLSRAGGEEGEVRSDALAYAAGAIVGTGALGVALLAVRATGVQAGWAFQLQDPRTIMLLLLLAVTITANLLGLFELPVLGGAARPAGGFGTGALAAFVATPCAGPFLGTALGAALALPLYGSVLVFAALGLGIAIPFVLVAFVPAVRNRLPKPGPWMRRFQRFLAIPMAASAAACLWLLYRQAGQRGLLTGALLGGALLLLALVAGAIQRRGRSGAWVAALASLALVAVGVATASPSVEQRAVAGAEKWSDESVRLALAEGHPAFVYFTADWCLTCKANEAAAIDRDEVRTAFGQSGVKVLAGDWTNGDPEITRFLESRGRAGVPLYLWYKPGEAAEELPQILTPQMLISRAQAARR